MHTHDGAGAFTIDVQVTHVELASGLLDSGTLARVDGTGQTVDSAVGNLERVVEAARPNHGQHRAEDLFLLDTRTGLNIGKDRRLNEISGALGRRSANHQPPLALAD